jgi:hypothetical protein
MHLPVGVNRALAVWAERSGACSACLGQPRHHHRRLEFVLAGFRPVSGVALNAGAIGLSGK